MSVSDRSLFESVLVREATDQVDEGADDATLRIRQACVVACARERVEIQGRQTLQPIWTIADLDLIAGYGSGLIEPIVNAAQRLNKISDVDIEELAKNSEPTPAADS